MATQVKDYRFSIYMNNDQAKRALVEMEGESVRLAQKLTDLEKAGQRNSDEWKQSKKELDALKVKMAETKATAGLLALSYADLSKTHKAMMNDMRKAIPGSEHWQKLKTDIEVVSARMNNLKGKSDETGLSLSSMANGFNKYFTMFTTAAASITGISFALNSFAEKAAKMDDVYSDVRKTTGLTREEVVAMQEDFKKLDTRTAREDLNELAATAGKLGKSSRSDVLDFVEGANQIKVALGEDLGKDAIQDIGKLVEIFRSGSKDLKDMDYKQQLLSVGSAVNALGQSSSASESYLVEFTKRTSGFATQTGISIQNILGWASALDQAGQNVEMSATAMQAFTMKMIEDPAKFAKMAGKDVAEFTKLVKTDTNQALVEMITSLSKKGGLDKLIPLFNDMKLDGSRAVNVLSAMATHIDWVQKAQTEANTALLDGTSITNEYSTKNDNLQARLEKARKNFADLTEELGTQLNPALLHGTSLMTNGVRALMEVIKFTARHRTEITTVAIAIAAYSTVQGVSWLWNKKINEELLRNIIITKVKIAWERTATAATALHAAAIFALDGNYKKASQTMGVFFRTLGLNPYTAVITGVLAIAAAIYLFAKNTNTLSQAQKSLTKVQSEVDSQFAEHKSKTDALIATIHNENIAHGQRLKAIQQLKQIIPGYTAELSKEGKVINENKKALRDYLEEMKKKIIMSAVQDEMTELIKKNRQLNKDLQANNRLTMSMSKANAKSPDITIGEEAGAGAASDIMLGTALQKSINIKNQIKGNFTAIKALQTEYGKNITSMLDTPVTGSGEGDGSGYNPDKKESKDDAAKKAADKAVEDLKDAWNKKQSEIKRQYADGKINEAEYQQQLYDGEVDYLGKVINALKSHGQQYGDIENQISDKRLAHSKEEKERLEKVAKEAKEKSLHDLIAAQEAKETELSQRREKEKMSESQYQAELLKIQEESLNKQLEVLNLTEDEKARIRKQIEDNKQKQTDGRTKDRSAFDEKYGDPAAKLKAQKEAELKVLEDFEARGIISHEEAIKAKKVLDRQFLLDFTQNFQEVAQQISNVAGNLSSAISGFQSAEISSVERKYKQQIKAAGKNTKQVAALEEKQQQEVAAIKAKYADKAFILNVAQITASTALAAISAYASAVKTPIIGPALAPIAAAAAIAAGAAQIAQANQARQDAKAGYFEGGPTGGSDPYEVRGYFPDGQPYHGNEYVVPDKGVRNPAVKQFLDVFEVARRSGRINMINTSEILRQVTTTGVGRYNGGYVTTRTAQATQQLADTGTSQLAIVHDQLSKNAEVMERMIRKLDEPLQVPISGKNGIAYGLDKYRKMIANKSR